PPRSEVLRHAVHRRLHRDAARAPGAVALNGRHEHQECCDMDTARESQGEARARFWFVFALFLVLMALAHGGAELKAWLDARAPGTTGHTVVYYRAIFTIWATIVLLTPALCFYIFSRAGAPNSYWRAFWTSSVRLKVE